VAADDAEGAFALTVDQLLITRYHRRMAAAEWRALRLIPLEMGLSGRLVGELTVDEATRLALVFKDARVRAAQRREWAQQRATWTDVLGRVRRARGTEGSAARRTAPAAPRRRVP
jgi:hypothetical protein